MHVAMIEKLTAASTESDEIAPDEGKGGGFGRGVLGTVFIGAAVIGAIWVKRHLKITIQAK